MANRHDRDGSIEHLLRQTAFPVDAPGASCVDPERLAAWSEGGLASGDAALVETHLSTCGRCQAMLAVFAESAPVTHVPAVAPFWQRWTVRWLVPAAAAAIGVVGWTITRGVTDAPEPTMTARVETAPAPSSVPDLFPPPAPPSSTQSAQARVPSAVAEAPALSSPSAASVAAPSQRAARVPAPPPPSSAADTAISGNPPAIAPPSSARTPSGPAPAPSSPARPPAGFIGRAAPPPDRSEAGSRQAARPQGFAERPAGDSGQNNVMMSAISVLESTSVPHARLSERAVFFGTREGSRTAADAASTAPATGARVYWSLWPDGRIERIQEGTDGPPLALPGTPLVTAGSAPSPLVCWLVTRDGRVLRTVNAADFQTTQFSLRQVPLVSIEAVDADTATVATGDGRTFVTNDAGATWRQN